MSEMENAFKQEKQPTSKKENSIRTEKNFDRVVDLDLLT